ncbi:MULTISPECIES: Sec-independent protein translocase subunit TatA/TatB [unclassified Capnocytophaga]|jgi:Sec-independent protein secretion pathway components|uniref:Sec-independent protein translocase subunit TatA/TatB n=1 Tax=unclassified Capnocytophaga TaxID=2640652 RepID=UPI000202E4BB|nr:MULTISPECIES: twin-arginine translocase TatA/TatE family subunit [unclassified Capnocytophaga]EGD34151.1 sec-independent protein translocase [Capnocytophaga sp. oral taxon 338 str. F0234]MEB3004835.1 twin-arginine translocase TatA/TatE family subunit [Capnocytophaga sp. G2]
MVPLFISTPELFFVLFVAVLLFGTDKIPEIARTLGKGMRQLRDATSEIKNEINKSVEKAGVDTSLIDEVKEEVEKAKEGLEDPFGSIKRNK